MSFCRWASCGADLVLVDKRGCHEPWTSTSSSAGLMHSHDRISNPLVCLCAKIWFPRLEMKSQLLYQWTKEYYNNSWCFECVSVAHTSKKEEGHKFPAQYLSQQIAEEHLVSSCRSEPCSWTSSRNLKLSSCCGWLLDFEYQVHHTGSNCRTVFCLDIMVAVMMVVSCGWTTRTYRYIPYR